MVTQFCDNDTVAEPTCEILVTAKVASEGRLESFFVDFNIKGNENRFIPFHCLHVFRTRCRVKISTYTWYTIPQRFYIHFKTILNSKISQLYETIRRNKCKILKYGSCYSEIKCIISCTICIFTSADG